MRKFNLLTLLLLLMVIGKWSAAQTTINTFTSGTNYTGGNGVSGNSCITFNVTNTSGGAILLDDVSVFAQTASNNSIYTLWYHPTVTTGAPTITTANGWVSIVTSAPIPVTVNGVTPIFSGLGFNIPDGTTYRFALQSSINIRYSGTSPLPSPTSFTSGGITLTTYVAGTSYGGAFPSPPNNPRAFTGSLTFNPAAACTAPPTPGTSTATPSSGLCIGSAFTLGLTGNSAGTGQTYQWQSGPTATGPWTNIGTLSNSSSLIQTASTTTYYQCEVTCSGSSQYSTPVLVNVPVAFPAGTYTIDQTQPASATNFTSFTSAVAAISCGIAGPIVFDVVSGTGPYLEQITIPSTVGATAANTVTFNGNSNTLSVAGNAAVPHTLGLNGADYFTFNDLNVVGTDGTNALVCHLWNDANNNSFNNCTFTCNANTTGTVTVPFSVSGSATTATTTGLSGSNNVITNCTMDGGYYNTCFVGNSASPATGNKVLNCTLKDYYFYGSYNLYQNGIEVRGNNIHRPTRTTLSTFYGIYLSTGVTNAMVHKNYVHDPFAQTPSSTAASYGIYVVVDASVGNENKIFNNVVYNMQSNGTTAGIYLSGADYVQVYNNTISLDYAASTLGTVYGIYNTGTVGGIDIQNNVISIVRGGTGTKYCLYFSTTLPTSDYNDLYINSPAGTNNIGYSGVAYTTLSAWQGQTPARDLLSVDVAPGFINPSLADFKPNAVALNNSALPIAYVTEDILSVVRNATPDMGAYEFDVLTDDLTINSMDAPTIGNGCKSASEFIGLTLKNVGLNAVDFSVVPVTINVNITGPVSNTFSETITAGTMAPGATLPTTLTTPIDLSIPGTYTFDLSCSYSLDGNAANDILPTVSLTLPVLTPGTIATASTIICVSGSPSLTLTGNAGGNIQWQESTTGPTGPWTNVGSGGNSYTTASPYTVDTWVQAELTCNANVAASNVIAFDVVNPAITSTTDGSRCGPGIVNLNATSSAGTNVLWFAASSGGAPLFAGNTYSPSVTATTTYYAEANTGSGGAGLTAAIPLANGGTTGVYHHMFMVNSPTGMDIQNFGIKCNDAIGTLTAWNIYYRPDNYQLVPGSNLSATGWTLLSSTTGVPSLGNTAYTVISTPLALTIPPGATYSFYIAPVTGTHQYATSAAGTQLVANANCTFVAGHRGSTLFNCNTTSGQAVVQIGYSLGCTDGIRVPVLATVNSAPSITATAADPALCPGGTTTVSVSSSNDPNYTYSWTSSPAGFTGSGAGPLSVSPTNTTTYIVNAIDNTAGPFAGCENTTSVTVITAPTLDAGTVSANISEHCITGSSLLTVTGAQGGAIQWEESTLSSTGPWTAVGTGATTYNTGTLTQTTYYRVSVTCQNTTTVSSTPITITVNNPTITSTTPGATCGTGSATLQASSTGTVKWYANANGGSSLATGNTFNTPTISSNTMYYAAAASGSGATGTTPFPAVGSTFAGNVRGYWFTAPSNFTITGLNVPLTGTVQHLAVIKFDNNTPPPTYSTTTNAFTTLFLSQNNSNTGVVPVNIPILAGEVIGIFGQMGTGSAYTTPTGPVTTTIDGQSVTLTRMGMQFPLGTTAPQQVWQEPASAVGQVIITYAVGCENPVRTPVLATVETPNSFTGLAASYVTTDAAVTLTGTPSGGTFSGPGISGNTFDPAIAGPGTHTITYGGFGGACADASQQVTVTLPPSATLNLTAFLEGYVTGLGTMNEVLSFQGLPNPITDCDDVTVELHDASTPYAMAHTFSGILQTNGTLTCTFPAAAVGNSYYIVVKNRNHMETWSANPVTMASTTSYNFSTAQAQAYGTPGNLVETPLGSGQWAMYSGDINQDLSIDAQDYLLLDPDIVAGNSGYLTTDLNGDGSVDALDYLILDPNISAGITIQAP